jgi:hypothetical protein
LSGYQAEAAKLLAGMSPARRKRRTAAEKQSSKQAGSAKPDSTQPDTGKPQTPSEG